ncbi:MAG: glycosyltransferase family 39 protein, partial [Armatimonadetes bacterium]|nr:glycosyltransferase family 39 protein [Armatimonadota bacterium]
ELFGRDAAVRSALLVAILPAFALGTVFAFPDVPLAFFWVLALWAGWRALQQGGWWWPVVGALAGLALLSKLTALGFIAGLGGAWLWGSWRRPLREPAFYLGALLAAALFAPVVLWNIRHDWFTLDVTFNRDRWVEAPSAVGSLLIFAGAQLVYYGAVVPVLVAAAIAAAGRFREAPWRYLAWMSLPMFAATLVGAPGGFARPHWPGPAYLAAALALGALWPQWQVKRPRLLRAALGATALATVVLLTAGLTPWGTVRIRDGIGHWERVAAAAGRQAMAGDPPALIVAEGYQTASHLAYHLRERVPVTAFQGAFLLWQRRDEWTGRRVVYVDEHPTRHRIDIQAICRNLRPLEDVTVAPRRRITLHGCEEARFP